MDQCWNPRLLRVRVGNALFDFPKDAYRISVPQHSDERGRLVAVPNLVELDFDELRKDPLNRSECNKKGTGPIDGKDELSGTHQKDFGTDRQREYVVFSIYQYKPESKYPDFDRFRDYVSDITDADKVRLISSVVDRNGKAVTYTFGYGGQKLMTHCQIWDDSKMSESFRKNPRPPFANSCSPKMSYRMDGVLIAMSEPPALADQAAGIRTKLLPEQWPAYWANTVKLLASYRVEQADVVAR